LEVREHDQRAIGSRGCHEEDAGEVLPGETWRVVLGGSWYLAMKEQVRSFVRELTIPEYVDYRSVYEVSICLTCISYIEVTWISSRIYERISQGGR
jgi:hypothetical protein